MVRASDRTTIFFIAGTMPTSGEVAAIAAIEGIVRVRSVLHNARYGTQLLEQADYVSSLTATIPPQYAAAYQVYTGSNMATPVTTFCAAGDSRTASCTTNNASTAYLETSGTPAWALSMIGGVGTMEASANYGVGGDSSQQLSARWSAVLADSAKNIIMMIGVNDGGAANLTLAQSQGYIGGMLDSAGAAGKIVLLANETPYEAISGTRLENHFALHYWLQDPNGALKNRPWVFSYDSWQAVSDPALRNKFVVSYTIDGLHSSCEGHERIGCNLAAVIRGLYPAAYIPQRFKLADELATGLLNTNPLFTGTGGTFPSNTTNGTVNGTLPDGYYATVQSAAGMTFACSLETDAANRKWLRVDASGTPTANNAILYINNDFVLTSIAEGAAFRGSALIEYYNCVNMNGCTIEASSAGGQTYKARARDCYDYTRLNPQATRAIEQQVTPRGVKQVGATKIYGAIVIVAGAANVAASGTFRIALPTYRAVA